MCPIAGGNFGTTFFFHEHPNCIVAAVADLLADRRKRLAQVYRCDNMYESLEAMLEKESGSMPWPSSPPRRITSSTPLYA